MTVATRTEAFEKVREYIGNYTYDVEASKSAGYSIYKSDVNSLDYVSDLGTRLEVNLGSLKESPSINIWIDDKAVEIERLEEKIKEQAQEIIRLKAMLYDYMVKEYLPELLKEDE